jgi:hypothetical protein
VISPLGAAVQPADEACNSFYINASESGYSGSFTISMSGGSNGFGGTDYALPPQTPTQGLWLVSPGLICARAFQAVTTVFTVRDQDGHSASTYITSF